jgi:hypothetical protein
MNFIKTIRVELIVAAIVVFGGVVGWFISHREQPPGRLSKIVVRELSTDRCLHAGETVWRSCSDPTKLLPAPTKPVRPAKIELPPPAVLLPTHYLVWLFILGHGDCRRPDDLAYSRDWPPPREWKPPLSCQAALTVKWLRRRAPLGSVQPPPLDDAKVWIEPERRGLEYRVPKEGTHGRT